MLAATGLSRSARVAAIIRNGQWRWSWTTTDELQGIKQFILQQPSPNVNEQDKVIWVPNQSGKFTIKSAWESIRSHRNQVDWHKLVWFPRRIPKTVFCLWLAVRGRLGTQDRCPNLDPNMKWLFCNGCMEDHNHLFFSCNVTSQIWGAVQNTCGLYIPNLNWTNLIGWLVREWTVSNLQTISRKLLLAGTVYNIWFERNLRLHSSGSNSVPQITDKILELVKMKLSILKGFQDTAGNRATQVQ